MGKQVHDNRSRNHVNETQMLCRLIGELESSTATELAAERDRLVAIRNDPRSDFGVELQIRLRAVIAAIAGERLRTWMGETA